MLGDQHEQEMITVILVVMRDLSIKIPRQKGHVRAVK